MIPEGNRLSDGVELSEEGLYQIPPDDRHGTGVVQVVLDQGPALDDVPDVPDAACVLGDPHDIDAFLEGPSELHVAVHFEPPSHFLTGVAGATDVERG